MRILTIIAAFMLFGLFASEAQAQRRVVVTPYGYGYGYGWNGGWGGSTVYGDWQRGRGAWLNGYGNYLYNRGQYELYHEQARRQYIDNWQRYVETRQKLKDAYNARKAQENAERRERLQRYLEKQRSKTLNPKIGWNGRWFSSIEELRADPEYQEFLAERRK